MGNWNFPEIASIEAAIGPAALGILAALPGLYLLVFGMFQADRVRAEMISRFGVSDAGLDLLSWPVRRLGIRRLVRRGGS